MIIFILTVAILVLLSGLAAWITSLALALFGFTIEIKWLWLAWVIILGVRRTTDGR